ncbi:MAG: hypothetical protein KatS3mg022_1228 [Armatimonadota bacterium]|nr:MAG: hypothetical protein KatS3mg022_1228 [Armatimonadota bacterium]
MRTAWQNRLVWVLGVVVALGAVLALWQSTQAQLEVPPAPNDMVAMQPGQPLPPPPGPGVPPGQPPVGQPFPGFGERLALGQVAIAANSEYVYVVRGNMLYQFSAKTLELVKSAELPRPQIRRPAAGAETQPQNPQRLRRRLQDQAQPPAGQP